MTCDEVSSLLSARLDQETDRTQSGAVDSHLETCSACAGEMARLREVQATIRNGMHAYMAPAGLRDRVRFSLRSAAAMNEPAKKPEWRSWGAAAAAVALCAAGSGVFLVNERSQRRMAAEELFSAHQRALMTRDVDVVSTDNHTVKPWFNGKLPFSPPVVNLAAEGFPLEGGRVDFVEGRRVAALVYGRRLHRIDVFVRPADGRTSPARFDREGFTEMSWTSGEFLFTAVSDLNPAELTVLKELLRRQGR